MPDLHCFTPRISADDTDTPICAAAMDAIDAYVGQRNRHGFVDVATARQRVAVMRSYLHILEEEMQTMKSWGPSPQFELAFVGAPS